MKLEEITVVLTTRQSFDDLSDNDLERMTEKIEDLEMIIHDAVLQLLKAKDLLPDIDFTVN